MTPSNRVGLAMVGCGQIAEAHLKAVAAIQGLELVLAVDVDADRAKSVASRYGAPRWSASYDDVLSEPAVDGVVICLPHDLHRSYSIRASEAGKHVLVEKPMAMSEAEGWEMTRAAEQAGTLLCVGQSTRYMATHQRAKLLLEEGRIGRVIHVLLQRTFWVETLSTDWRRDQHACGGLYLPLFGSHDVDTLLWLLRDAPSRIWGAVRSASPVSDGDSDGFIGLEFADGKLASLAFATRCRHSRYEIVLVGSEGTLVLTRPELRLNDESLEVPPGEEAFVLQMRRFSEAIREGREPPAPGREVLKVLRTLDLVRRASETGQAMVF